MDFQKLKHLLAVVEHGTFSRAAEAVNLSQPALSRSIRPWKRAGPAAARPRHAPATPDRLRRLRRGARAPHAPRRDRATARTQAHARRRIRQPQHRPESHSGLVAAVSPAGPYDGAPSAGARQRGAGRDRCAAGAAARRTHRRAGLRRAPAATSTRSRWRRCAPAWCAGPDIPSWRIGASASRRSGNTGRVHLAQSGSLAAAGRDPGPRRRSRTNGDRALREPGSADAPGAGQRRAAARRDQRHPPRAGSRPAAGSAATASGAATMRWRAWPAARRRRCWMRSMPTRGAGPTSRPTRNDRVEKTDRVHARG